MASTQLTIVTSTIQLSIACLNQAPETKYATYTDSGVSKDGFPVVADVELTFEDIHLEWFGNVDGRFHEQWDTIMTAGHSSSVCSLQEKK